MPHRQSVKDSDPHFAIDSASRQILNKSQKQISLIQGDHNSERFTFDLPREIEKHDMSLCNKVQIHYINIGTDGKEFADVYEPSDFGVSATDDKIVTCSWLISGNATKYAGTLNFIVRYLCINNGEIDYSWGTAIYKGIPVSDTINNGETVIENHSDILIAWINEIEKSVDGKVTAAVDKAVEEKVSDAVDEAVNAIVGDAVDKAIEDAINKSDALKFDTSNIANAVKGYASGTRLQIDDISPLASKVKVNVVGKQPPEVPAMMMMRSASPASEEFVNLIPFVREDGKLGYADCAVGESVTIQGITFTVNNDGSITAVGVTGINSATFVLYRNYSSIEPFEQPEKYYTLFRGGTANYNIGIRYYRNADANSDYQFIAGNNGASGKLYNATGLCFYFAISASQNLSKGVTFYPMIVEGRDVAITEYVPPQSATADGGNHTHIDADKDHFCDDCGEQLSACVDNDKDHHCDYGCGAVFGTHLDSDKDHACDYGCTSPIGEHADNDHDHLCDYCGAVMSQCQDAKGDGFCDICGKKMHTCADENGDHLCDICGAELTECVDNNKDHLCDICGAAMSAHCDDDCDHICDYCGEEGQGEHADNDGDGLCDYCGKIVAGGVAVTIKTSGKNLLPHPYSNTEITEDSLSLVDDGTGTVTVNGVCSSKSVYFKLKKADDTYLEFPHDVWLSGCPKGGDNSRYVIRVTDNEIKESLTDYGSGILIPKGFKFNEAYIRIQAGYECNNLVFKPQIEYGTTATEHEQYREGETLYIVPGATVELTPIYPSMVITTDKDDVILSAEYTKDTNSVISELCEAIQEGGVTDADKEEIKDYINESLTEYAPLVDGKVPASHLPSYVDDIVNGIMSNGSFQVRDWLNETVFDEIDNDGYIINPRRGVLYVSDEGESNPPKIYRWSGTAFVEVSSGSNCRIPEYGHGFLVLNGSQLDMQEGALLPLENNGASEGKIMKYTNGRWQAMSIEDAIGNVGGGGGGGGVTLPYPEGVWEGWIIMQVDRTWTPTNPYNMVTSISYTHREVDEMIADLQEQIDALRGGN